MLKPLPKVYAWTPLMPELVLHPGTTIRVNLTAMQVAQAPHNAVVALLTAKQRSTLMDDLQDGAGYSPNLWRSSLASPVHATFTTWSQEPQALGVIETRSLLPPTVVTGEVSFEAIEGHHLPPELQVACQAVSFLCFACVCSLVALLAWVILKKNWRNRVGWKITRSALRSSEWMFVLVALTVGMLLRLMALLCSVMGACNPLRYRLTVFTVNALCSLVVIVATNFNIFLLTRQLQESHVTQEAAFVYAKVYAFLRFRVCYLYFIMLEVLSGAALRVMSVRSVWMIRELVEWGILTAVLWVWRPGYDPLPLEILGQDETSCQVFELADPAEVHSSSEDAEAADLGD
eukprot:Skav227170  [mRNA]  locus=scaffold1396:11788:19281:+ [translate_table: standard]